MPACPAQGPSAAEERMLTAYDTFERLLNTKPVLAAELAYQVSELVERYQPQRVAATANEGDRHVKSAA